VANSGAAFGFFQGWTGALTIVGIAIVLAVIYSAAKVGHDSNGGRMGMLALGLVTGGAIGNLIDRIRLGYVVDFIDVYGPRININNTVYGWPVFNVADSAITIGVLLLLLTLVVKREKDAPAEKDEPAHYANPGHSA
jgi:signal peptidase II